MSEFLLSVSGLVFLLLMAIYVLAVYLLLVKKDTKALVLEPIRMLFHIFGMYVLWTQAEEPAQAQSFMLLCLAEEIWCVLYQFSAAELFPKLNRLLLREMMFLANIGFVVLARLRPSHAWRQFLIIAFSMTLAFLAVLLIQKLRFLCSLGWLYALIGIGGLAIVLFTGNTVNGSRLTYRILGLTFQPSEAIKLVFAFCMAAILCPVMEKYGYEQNEGNAGGWKKKRYGLVLLSGAVAAIHVLLLVLSRDLGSGLIFFVMYVAMLYTATEKARYLILGTVLGLLAAVAGYFLFSHVRVRVNVWLDPWADPLNRGYQLTQSLFGIASGSWGGLGLGQGAPWIIPYVEEDLVFSAIAEEFGVLFGLLLILLCLGVVCTMFRIAGRTKNCYYRIVAAGLSVCYAVQVVLTIGGGTGLIPLTGVTLPLISNGGTSALVTVMLFSVLQGIHLLSEEEGTAAVRHKEKTKGTKTEGSGKRGIIVNVLLYAVIYLAMILNILIFLIGSGKEAAQSSYNFKRQEILLERGRL